MSTANETAPARPLEDPAEARPTFQRGLWPYALTLAVGIFILVPSLGSFGFWDPWEPKYAETAREMIEKDSWVVPYYRHEVRLTKPILVYWGILAGSAVFGLNEFGARIVGVLLALASMAGAYYVVSSLRGRQAGLICALVLGSVPQFYFISRQAMPDVYLFTSLGSCLLFFCLGLFGPDRRRDLHFLISYACFGLAILAKGPVIIGAVFFTTLAVFLAIRIDPRELWREDRRLETARFAVCSVAGAAMVGFFSLVAFLFGTSPLWWGYNEEGRETMAFRRDQIQDAFSGLFLAEGLLVLFALVCIAGVAWTLRRIKNGDKAALLPMTLLALAALQTLLCLLLGSGDFRIFASGAFGVIAGLVLLYWSTRRFLIQPWLWPIVKTYLRPTLRQLALFVGALIVVAGPWQLAILIKQGHGYFTDFIIKHNVQRAGETINRSGVSEFYLRVMIFGYYPWSALIPVALAGLVAWWNDNPLKKYAFEIYLLIASVITFTAFTSSATKFAHYLSPLIIPVAVLIGLAVNRTLEHRDAIASRLAWIVALMLFLLPTLDLIDEDGFKYLVGSFTMKRFVPDTLAPGAYYQALLIVIGVSMAGLILVRARILVGTLMLGAVLLANHTTTRFIPELSMHKTMKNLCETWKANERNAPICFYGDLKHGIFFYTEYEIDRLRKRQDFIEFMDPERPAFCIVERAVFSTLHKEFRRKYEDSQLYEADPSHFKYVLISNYPTGKAAEE